MSEQERAQRARDGSGRRRDRDALRAQGGTPPTKGDRERGRLEAERESERARRAAMDWVREQAPWLPDGWVGIYAGYAMRLQHRGGGKRPSIDDITEHLRGTSFANALADPKIGIKAGTTTKGAT